ncbi:hypothetical protein [Carnimonas sp. LMG 33810]
MPDLSGLHESTASVDTSRVDTSGAIWQCAADAYAAAAASVDISARR